MAQLLNVKTIFLLKRGCSTLRLLAATAVRRLQPDNEDSNGKTETEKSKKDCLMPDLCVICLEQEYNVVFVPCGHMCCCTTCYLA
ncbi:E3 ubiquitin-protein ligase SP1-like isoform X2 [Papaver somniferum]|uniref:E3 ubiquitin-protein ligase SP1-like isoform X2 n=1 Tax=Papaver somniferum TaxID=3469 RepID=UPI000E6F5C52|nr:E3 ubiquitin-protein ligase SP1-like isoform X2 [Papaver somniferum]